MFFCIPVIFGCQTTIEPEAGEQVLRICPRCHNASVLAAKSTNWFELFWVPLVPFGKKHIWLCSICQWQAPITGVEPYMSGQAPTQGNHFTPNADLQPGYQPGYAPAYVQK